MRFLRRVYPHPQLTALLTLVWGLLINALSLNSIVMGLILGTIIPLVTARFWPDRPTLRHPAKIVEYILIALWDIIVANIVVAGLILFRRNADMHPAWVAIPLELRSPEAITVLAGTITLTPGTVTADLSTEGHLLLVHCLNAEDPDAVRDEIKQRYERRLKEIFE